MKKNNISSVLAIILLSTFLFSSCSKNDPVPEVDQEEHDRIELIFEPGSLNEGVFVASDEDDIVVTFDKNGTPSLNEVNLFEGGDYRMQINLFHKESNINDEILEEADEHQFFFLGAPENILDYEYTDERVGLTGILSVVGSQASAFDFNIILRHGLNKNHASASRWNSSEYVQAGGANDLEVSVKVRILQAD